MSKTAAFNPHYACIYLLLVLHSYPHILLFYFLTVIFSCIYIADFFVLVLPPLFPLITNFAQLAKYK